MSEIVCVVEVEHSPNCRNWSPCRVRADWQNAQVEQIHFEGHEYQFRLPVCRVPIMGGRVAGIMEIAAKEFRRSYIHGDASGVVYHFYGALGRVDYVAECRAALADVTPAYHSAYTCYYWLRDLARAFRPFKRLRLRCEYCHRIHRSRAHDWYSHSFCSYSCQQAGSEQIIRRHQREEREKRIWRKGRKTLKAIRQLLRERKNRAP